MRGLLRTVVCVGIALLATAALSAEAITRAYCQAPGQDFVSQCDGLDLTVAQAECDTRKALARQQCDVLSRDWGGALLEEIGKKQGEIIAAAAGVVAAALLLALAFLNNTLRNQLQRITGQLQNIKRGLADPFLDPLPIYESFAVNAMVVGKGGAGKTSIIRALSASDRADPTSITATNLLFSIALEVTIGSDEKSTHRRLTRIFMSDHVGQDPATILKAEFYTNPRLGHLPKCLVIVVDLFPPQGLLSPKDGADTFDNTRIASTLQTFTPEHVRVITAPLSPGDQIVLFINKIDMLKSLTAGQQQAARSAYLPLAELLRGVGGARFSMIVGSADLGWGITGARADPDEPNLLAVLCRAAVPVKS